MPADMKDSGWTDTTVRFCGHAATGLADRLGYQRLPQRTPSTRIPELYGSPPQALEYQGWRASGQRMVGRACEKVHRFPSRSSAT